MVPLLESQLTGRVQGNIVAGLPVEAESGLVYRGYGPARPVPPAAFADDPALLDSFIFRRQSDPERYGSAGAGCQTGGVRNLNTAFAIEPESGTRHAFNPARIVH